MRILITIVFIFTCAVSKAQVNLVLNPSLEHYDTCQDGADQITSANFWSGIDSLGQNSCVPEYCNACIGIGMMGIPIGGSYAHQYPRSGSAFAHVQMFYDEFMNGNLKRDYLQGRFHSTLDDGQSYCVTFYVNLTEGSRYPIDKIGAYLDDGIIDNTNTCSLPQTQYTPQVQNTLGIIGDTMNWVKIEGTFTSNGTEEFITIGNFFNFANTNYVTTPNQYNDNDTHFSWYLVDDVSVIPSDLPAYAGPDTWVVVGDSVFVGRTPEIGLECKWYVSGNVIDSGAGIWAKPTVTTTYVVEQTLCGLVKTDTVVVGVFPASINGLTNSRQLSIYPNPATTVLTVSQEKVIFNTAVIVNNLGQELPAHIITAKESHIDISSLPAGLYYLQLSGDKGREVRSFVKM